VTEWFDEHESEALSPDLNMFVPLWNILEKQIRKHFPSLASHSDLATVLEEEWFKMLRTVKNIPKII